MPCLNFLQRITSIVCNAATPFAMYVRPLTQSVLRWPRPEHVLHKFQAWAEDQSRALPSLQRVGVFGIYGRGLNLSAAISTSC